MITSKRRYCVIVNVGHFCPPYFGPIYTWYLLYIPKSLIFTPIFSLCLPPLDVSINGHNEHARGAWTRGKEGGVTSVAQSSSQMCAQNYSGAQFIVPSRGLIPGPSTAPGPTVGWRGYLRGSFLSTTLRPRLWSAINPTMHVQYGFINFLCHESTQIREYDQVLLS